MDAVLQWFVSIWELIVYIFSGMGLNDIIDIAAIAFILYKCIGFFRQTRGGQLIKGIIVLLVIVLIAQWLNMVMVKWVIAKIVDSILIAAVVIFQPELRRALESVGTSKISSFNRTGMDDENEKLQTKVIDAVAKAAGTMQEQKCGALIVFERTTQLGEIVDTGTVIDAAASPSIVCNLFYPKSPLHDGAMIIRDGRVLAAGCILPLTQRKELNKALGTRHRAAIGMSENSDAVVVVVSEETGNISIAFNGKITRNFDAITLRNELMSLLIEKTENTKTDIFTKLKSSIKSLFSKQKSGEENK